MTNNTLIFGDSYSTFKGHIPDGYASWYSEKADPERTDVTSVCETWWYQVMQKANLTLVHNNSWSGSPICYTGYNNSDCSESSSFIYRLRELIENGFFNKNRIDTVFVFGGTNDYFWSDKPIAGEDDTAFAHAVETIGKWVCEKRKGKITLFVTPYPHNGIGNYEGGAFWKDSNQHDTSDVNFNGQVLSDYVAVIEAACQKLGLPCLNLHKNFDFDWQKHTSDGCHPNEAGHRLLADVIVAELKKLFAQA